MSIHRLFELQAARTPDAVALEFNGHCMPYAELNQRSDQLAAHLRNQGVTPDTPVGLCMDRSLEAMVAVLAVLKAGAAYLPLDPNYPTDRLAFMLQDSGASTVLTQSALTSRLPTDGSRTILSLDQFDWKALAALSPEAQADNAEALAYVIYTSGSTGQPKGVAMVHRALTNLLDWHRRTLPTSRGEKTLQFTSLSFDVSFQEIFTTWCEGGTLVLMADGLRRDPLNLWRYLREHQINRLFLPFSALSQLAEVAGLEPKTPDSLREVITAGEELQCTPRLKALFRRLPGTRLHNHYGPSETHVVTSYTLPQNVDEWPDLPPIGRPIDDCYVRILDINLEPVANGEEGELFLGGSCLARGYLGRSDLTAERFIQDPLKPGTDDRLYKTGDLCRMQSDGNLKFLGRTDFQVKIRGYRIDLGEIEMALRKHPAVQDAVVNVRSRGSETELLAFVVLQNDAPPPIDVLSTFLGGTLADYMLPAHYVFIDQLPLTPSGKLDRRALSMPGSQLDRHPQNYVAPVGDLELRMAAIWQDVLQMKPIGATENFFEIGGTSVSIVTVQRRIQEAVGHEVPITLLFQHSTIRSIAAYLQNGDTISTRTTAARARAEKQRAAVARRRALGGKPLSR